MVDPIPSLIDPAVLDDPFAAYAEMHQRCPVSHVPELKLHVVAPYDEVRRVLSDTTTFSNRPPAGGRSGSRAMISDILAERGWVPAEVLQATDPPQHTRHRKLLGRVFTNRRVQTLVPRIEQIVAELIDRVIDDGRMEFVSDFAVPMPGIFICEQYGLPAEQYPTFRRWAEAMVAHAQRPLSPQENQEVADILIEAQHHLAAEFEQRRNNPSDDLISALVHAHDDPDDPDEPLSINELQGLMTQLVSGGFETTTSALSTGLWLLLRHPDQMEKLRADRSLLRNFVEESLRFDSPVSGLWRTTTCPVTVAGTELPAGTNLMPRYAAANRDPEVFPDPDRFDIERENASQHLAFGLGAHYCIGAALARAELLASFEAILDRMADIRLAEPLDEQPHQQSLILRPMKRLPITFTKA